MSTQTQHPARATWRTTVASIVAAVLALGIILPAVVEIVDEELAAHLPESWVAWLYAAAALVTAVTAALTRIMAIPGVDEALRRIGLSSAPNAYPVAAYSTSDVVETTAGEVVTIDQILMSRDAEMASYQVTFADGSPGLVHESEIARMARPR